MDFIRNKVILSYLIFKTKVKDMSLSMYVKGGGGCRSIIQRIYFLEGGDDLCMCTLCRDFFVTQVERIMSNSQKYLGHVEILDFLFF